MLVLAEFVVVGFALFLLGLGTVIVIRPALAEKFLRGFASSAETHYSEQVVRLIVGAGLVTHGPAMRFPEAFTLFGWLIIGSTMVLLLIPWRWHHKFAARVMPPVYGRLRLFAAGAFALGSFVLYALLSGDTPT